MKNFQSSILSTSKPVDKKFVAKSGVYNLLQVLEQVRFTVDRMAFLDTFGKCGR